MPAVHRASSSTAGEKHLRLPTPGLNRVSFKETDRHIRYLLRPPDGFTVDAKILNISGIERIVVNLEMKYFHGNILERSRVRLVYFQCKTFKSFQVLINLSSSKNTE
jgi:hypothetical protein